MFVCFCVHVCLFSVVFFYLRFETYISMFDVAAAKSGGIVELFKFVVD